MCTWPCRIAGPITLKLLNCISEILSKGKSASDFFGSCGKFKDFGFPFLINFDTKLWVSWGTDYDVAPTNIQIDTKIPLQSTCFLTDCLMQGCKSFSWHAKVRAKLCTDNTTLPKSQSNFGLADSWHYNDVIMSAVAFQITSLTIIYSTVYSGADQRKHQSSASLRPVTRKCSIWLCHHAHG